MSVDRRRAIASPRCAQGAEPCAEDILFTWLLRLPITVDPTEAARLVLAEVPAPPRETHLQQRLRSLLVELSDLSASPAA